MADGDHTRLSCVICSGLFQTLLRRDGTPTSNQSAVCGGACRNKLRQREPKPAFRACANCGSQFAGRFASLFCGDRCTGMAWRRSRRDQKVGACAHCGTSLIGTAHKTKYCGPSCRVAGYEASRRTAKAAACMRCGSSLAGKKGGAKYCSPLCCQKAKSGPKPRCAICNSAITAAKQMTYCSAACRGEGTRAYNAISSARRRGATADRFSSTTVFDRDGWRCQICGVSTPQSRRGTRHHNAPELDHIVALKNGGQHSLTNTQCACYACNRAKAAKAPAGQQGLFADMKLPPLRLGRRDARKTL